MSRIAARQVLSGYGRALGVVAVATALEAVFLPYLEAAPVLVFFIAVFLAGWWGGRGPGLVATAISSLICWYAVLPPRWSPELTLDGGVTLGLFVSASLLVTVLTDRLQRAERRAREAAWLREVFLSVAAHELRTPLTAIMLQHQLLLRGLERGTADLSDVARKLRSQDRAIHRLGHLIDTLLDVTRISAGRMQLQLEDIDLTQVVVEVTGRFQPASPSAPAVQVEATPGIVGRWDRMRLEQVVTNLVSNAVKYGEGRPVTVSVRRVEDRAELGVADQGIGIPAEDQARIFDRFERLVSEKHFGGLGLGLWIVREIVRSFGGSIDVKSAPGAGARFTVTLPLSGPAPGGRAPEGRAN